MEKNDDLDNSIFLGLNSPKLAKKASRNKKTVPADKILDKLPDKIPGVWISPQEAEGLKYKRIENFE